MYDPGLSFEGEILSIRGAKIVALLPLIPIGALCEIESTPASKAVVVAFNNDEAILLPISSCSYIAPGTRVTSNGLSPTLSLNQVTPWGVFNYAGESLTINAEPKSENIVLALEAQPPKPVERKKLAAQCLTGVRSIDALFPIAYGQRIALLAQPGVGKSTLLGTITRNAQVDCTIIGLIGERGREVNEFIDESVGDLNANNAMIFVATSDALPMTRWLTALAATRAAEYFRSQGKNVLLCIDSLTRCARAIREYSLVLGELPVRHGFTPSVYELLPRLLERAGNDHTGSITAVYTLLSEENGEDPLSSEIISLLDGHLFLSKQLAQRGIFPAIDPLRSISRLSSKLCNERQREAINTFIGYWSRLDRDRDMLQLGGTADEELLYAAKIEANMVNFLRQKLGQKVTLEQAQAELYESITKINS